jgi:aldehyde dehydrogenase (NAD+)
MSYGPAPESDDIAKKWLAAHDKNFGHFIDGKWYHPEGDRSHYVTKSPATGEVLTSTVQGTQEDVDYAVQNSNEAQIKWAKTPAHVRARHLYAIARTIQKHHRLLAVIESLDNGKSIRESRDVDVPLVARHFYHHAGWAQLMDTEMPNWKPVGVIGAIVPWNFPLMLLTWKVAPALAMGNTVVLKPATYTRLSALLLAEICAEAGLPAGVFNVVTGPGRFGSMLAQHADVDKVAFTGSTGVGQILRRATAGTGKKLSLELGGKSPVIVFSNADLDSTVEGIVDAVWFNQGQVCSAGSRLLVQEEIYDTLVARLKERLNHYRVGSSMDKCIDMGALVDKSQLDTCEEYVQSALDEGADVYQPEMAKKECEARNQKEGCYYYPPTMVTNVSTVSRVVREEIFGPVLAVMRFRTAKEAVALANNTAYGLGASVWSESLPVALEVALSVKAGAVWINAHNLFDAAAGFGGYRESGYGRDGGKEGLYEYVKPKWMQQMRLPKMEFDIKNFAKVFGETEHPIPGNNVIMPKDATLPSVDRTYKVYYGGAQKRPDGAYSRPVKNTEGKALAFVGDSNRKDVRNAVECAHKAQPGWGKRASRIQSSGIQTPPRVGLMRRCRRLTRQSTKRRWRIATQTWQLRFEAQACSQSQAQAERGSGALRLGS